MHDDMRFHSTYVQGKNININASCSTPFILRRNSNISSKTKIHQKISSLPGFWTMLSEICAKYCITFQKRFSDRLLEIWSPWKTHCSFEWAQKVLNIVNLMNHYLTCIEQFCRSIFHHHWINFTMLLWMMIFHLILSVVLGCAVRIFALETIHLKSVTIWNTTNKLLKPLNRETLSAVSGERALLLCNFAYLSLEWIQEASKLTLQSLPKWKNICICLAPAVTGFLHLLHSPRTRFFEMLKSIYMIKVSNGWRYD